MNCPDCGARMAHFINPSRYICPKESQHRATVTNPKIGDDHRNTGKRLPGGGNRTSGSGRRGNR